MVKIYVLVLQGYSGSEYAPIRDFFNVGYFHGCEPRLYQECLQENVRGASGRITGQRNDKDRLVGQVLGAGVLKGKPVHGLLGELLIFA